MATIDTEAHTSVLAEVFGPREGLALRLKQVALMVAGIAVLAASAKIAVPMWPVPVTMGTIRCPCPWRCLWAETGAGDDPGIHAGRPSGL